MSGAIIRPVARRSEDRSPERTDSSASFNHCTYEVAQGDIFCSFHRQVADGLISIEGWQPGTDPGLRRFGRTADGEALEPQLVRLRWRDAWIDEDEREAQEFPDDLIVTTIGYVVRSTEDLISVAAERLVQDGRVTYRATTHVWRSMLLEEPDVLLLP
jgi:hypothetical protein